MPRQPCRRQVDQTPPSTCFTPEGEPLDAAPVVLTIDELEAIRLADYDGLYQEDVAARMGVSRQTVGRILQTARKKVAEALAFGKTLRIEGGAYVASGMRTFLCQACGHQWEIACGAGKPVGCPACASTEWQRANGPKAGKRCGCRRKG